MIGYFKKNEICVVDCGWGFYFVGIICLKCNKLCSSCEGICSNCILCFKFRYKKDLKCVIDCELGFKLFFILFVCLVGLILFEGCVEVLVLFIF